MTPSSEHHNDQPHEIQKPIRSEALAAVSQFESAALAKIAPIESLKKQITASPILDQRIAFSPDGRRLAACSDRMIRLWDWPQGRCTRLIEGQLGQISGFAFLSDNQRLLFVDGDQAVLWDLDGHRAIWQRRIPFHGTTYFRIKLALLPDGQSYLTWDNATFYIWHLNGEERWDYLSTKSNYPIRAMAITPDQHWLAYARLWGPEVNLKNLRARDKEVELRYHRAQVETLAITQDGRTLISGGKDGLICMWDLAEKDLAEKDLAEKRLKDVLMGHSGPVWSLAVSADGRFLFSGGEDRILRVWDLAGGRCVQTLMGTQGLIHSIAVSPDGKAAAAGCRHDPNVTVWDLASGVPQQRQGGISLPVMALQGGQDGFWAADAQRSSGALRLDRFDRQGHSRHWHVAAGAQRKLNAVAISPDGDWLAAGGHRSVGIYDMRRGRLVHRLSGYQDYVKCLAFSPDGRRLITGNASLDGRLRIYDTQSGQCLHRIPVDSKQQIGMDAIACHPDGHRFLVSGISGISLWDLAAGRFIRKVLPISGERRLSAALAVHPDGQQFAVGVRESAIVLYDLSAGEQRQTFTGHTDRITALAFSPDGRLLYASDKGGLIRVWNLETGDCLAEAYNLEEGYLWTTPPDELAPDGWLHTNRPDLLILRAEDSAQKTATGERVVFIQESDLRFQDYLRLYRDGEMVMKRIYEPERYDALKRLRLGHQTALGAGKDVEPGYYLPDRVE